MSGKIVARKSKPCQCRVEQIAGMITCKRASGAIGSAQPGCEADNQKPGVEGSE